MKESVTKKRLASAIVSPQPSREANGTIRTESFARSLSLSFSPPVAMNGLENEQIIGALNEMELIDSNDDGMMDCDVQEDDRLEKDLVEIENKSHSLVVAGSSTAHAASKCSKTARCANRMNVPFSIQNKKTEFLRRGSP